MNGGTEYDIEELANKIVENKDIEGVTFSGGEPLLQSKALYKLGLILKEYELSIVVFTGFSYDVIEDINDANWNNLFSITDILISEPFVEEEKITDNIWPGSSNQEYHFFSERYSYLEDELDS